MLAMSRRPKNETWNAPTEISRFIAVRDAAIKSRSADPMPR